MTVEIKAFTNCDEATIVWRSSARIPGCRGFALERQARDANGVVTPSVVETRVGFAGDAKAQAGDHHPSRT